MVEAARHKLALAGAVCALAAVLNLACSDQPSGPPATATPIQFQRTGSDRASLASPEVVQTGGSPAPSGLTIEDNCVVGQMAPPPGRGQILGNGVNVVVDVNTPENFSRAVADTSSVVCRPGMQRGDVDQLVARLNGVPGIRVVESDVTGR
jgi:hypothetical protein